MHIRIGVPGPEYVHNAFALESLPQIIEHTKSVYPQCRLSVAHEHGPRTDLNRNKIVAGALLEGGVDYILWLDCDMVYPANIIERYLEPLKAGIPIDVIGALYFRRFPPFEPVVYERVPGDPPFKPIFPPSVEEDKLYDVDGLGYGGMLVNIRVYQRLGERKWTRYGANFHRPDAVSDRLSHDLQFCSDVREAGMTVRLHGGVRPSHLFVKPATIEDWREETYKAFTFVREPSVALIVLGPEGDGSGASALLRERAGLPCDIRVVSAASGRSEVEAANAVAAALRTDVVAYARDGAMPGHNWLKHALMNMTLWNAGLVRFHDGTPEEAPARFGLVNWAWMKKLYGGSLFFPEYKTWLAASIELTELAKRQRKYVYASKAVLLDPRPSAEEIEASDGQLLEARRALEGAALPPPVRP